LISEIVEMSDAQPRGYSRQTRGRRRGQAVVEFGLVALLFALLLMGTVDFAILLNGWLGVSSNARDFARQVAVGICPSAAPVSSVCLAGTPRLPADASVVIQGVDRTVPTPIRVSIKVCLPGSTPSCTGYPAAQLWDAFGGVCTAGCQHPASNDSIVLTITAQIQVVTPLVRPFFGCTNGSNPRCDVPITSQSVVRYEGTWI
jgi:hypothetical protein